MVAKVKVSHLYYQRSKVSFSSQANYSQHCATSVTQPHCLTPLIFLEDNLVSSKCHCLCLEMCQWAQHGVSLIQHEIKRMTDLYIMLRLWASVLTKHLRSPVSCRLQVGHISCGGGDVLLKHCSHQTPGSCSDTVSITGIIIYIFLKGLWLWSVVCCLFVFGSSQFIGHL